MTICHTLSSSAGSMSSSSRSSRRARVRLIIAALASPLLVFHACAARAQDCVGYGAATGVLYRQMRLVRHTATPSGCQDQFSRSRPIIDRSIYGFQPRQSFCNHSVPGPQPSFVDLRADIRTSMILSGSPIRVTTILNTASSAAASLVPSRASRRARFLPFTILGSLLLPGLLRPFQFREAGFEIFGFDRLNRVVQDAIRGSNLGG
jgi:hypothetical protein